MTWIHVHAATLAQASAAAHIDGVAGDLQASTGGAVSQRNDVGSVGQRGPLIALEDDFAALLPEVGGAGVQGAGVLDVAAGGGEVDVPAPGGHTPGLDEAGVVDHGGLQG